ncbi:hypothetical protein SOVF_179790 [Spinacia oleracea]|nr:hypothetical protein SOVF_179790 [Spinacia oleracea]
MHLSWLLLLLFSVSAATLAGTDALITPKNMITAAKTSKPGCQQKCGNLTIPYPFGIGQKCYFSGSFGIICNTSYNPPRTFPVIAWGWDIFDITETQMVIRNSGVASSCHDSQKNLSSSSTGLLDMWGSPFTVSSTANKLTVIGCNDYAVFGGSGDDAAKYQRAGCIAMCNNRAEPVAGSCPGLGCCQTSLPLGWNWQGFSITLFSVEDGQLTTIGKSLSDQSCSYAFYAKSGSFIFGGASDLVTNNTDDVRNRIMEQVPMVLDWNVQLKISCKQVKINSTSNPYLCQSNTKCVDTAEGGYRCSCLPGYEGNPYLQPGCTDINECVSGPNNPCYMTCVNTPGSYKCSCARGYVGDGLKSGTRCIFVNKRAANLIRITLGLGSSLGVIVLLLVAWWFSTIIKRRKIMKQKVKYFKQNGGLLLQEQMATDDSVVAAIKMFTIDELEKATDHFNQDRILGRGAGALTYLHSSSSIPIFHRDIKSSNILLDDTYRAKLSDFGTSKTVGIDQTHVTTPQVMGTFGYMDPEYHLLGQYTEKSDVYSFGVVLVELLTGQKAVRSALEEEKSLASWFLSHMKNPRLLDIIDSRVLQEDSKEEFLIIAEIAEKCLNQDRNSRPTMKEVLLEIEAVLSLHLPQANEQNWPKSEQIFSGSISDGVVSSSTAFYLENSSLSSAEVSLLFNSR